jgi:hypothetical protein
MVHVEHHALRVQRRIQMVFAQGVKSVALCLCLTVTSQVDEALVVLAEVQEVFQT